MSNWKKDRRGSLGEAAAVGAAGGTGAYLGSRQRYNKQIQRATLNAKRQAQMAKLMGWKADVPLANYLKPIVKNRRNTIAKWTLAPAIATGLVGAFIEKKAQTNTESGAAGMAAGAALGAAMAHPKSRKAIKKAISGRRRPGWAEKELANLSAKPFKSRSKSEQNKIFDVFNSVKAQKGTAEAKETIRKKFKLRTWWS